MKKNKRGDVPVTILVLGVVMICILAIVSFYTSSQRLKKGFDIEPVKEVNLINEKISVYQSLGMQQNEIYSVLGIKTDKDGRYVIVGRGDISVKYYLSQQP